MKMNYDRGRGVGEKCRLVERVRVMKFLLFNSIWVLN